MRNKKKGLVTIVATVCLVLMVGALLFLVVPSSEAKTITLRYADYNPPRGLIAEAAKWMMDEITKRTNGKVKFEQYFGGSLLKSRELLRGIQRRTADMGFLQILYYPKELRLWSVATPFLLGPIAPEKKAAFFWELYSQSPELEAEITSWNQKVVAMLIFGRHGVGGPRPLKSLADLKGLRVRCAGGYDAEHMSDLGAKIVFLRGTEVYSAMQKGAIDANAAPPTSYYKYKLYEIGDRNHLLVIPQFIGVVCLTTINLDTWNGLPADVQQVISDVGKEYSKIESEMVVALERDYLDKMKTAGCTIIEVPKEEVLRWANMTEERCKAKWVKEAKDQGLPGERLMELASQLIKKHSD